MELLFPYLIKQYLILFCFWIHALGFSSLDFYHVSPMLLQWSKLKQNFCFQFGQEPLMLAWGETNSSYFDISLTILYIYQKLFVKPWSLEEIEHGYLHKQISASWERNFCMDLEPWTLFLYPILTDDDFSTVVKIHKSPCAIGKLLDWLFLLTTWADL